MGRDNQREKKVPLGQKVALVLFGIFLTLLILEIGLRLGGFIILSLQEQKNLQSMKQKKACRIICLGESTTQCQYPSYLEEILNQRNIGIRFSVIDKGLGGTDTVMILSQLGANLDKYRPDIVVTMMGINDSWWSMLYEPVSNSRILLSLKSFRIYKLYRLLLLHASAKLKEAGFSVSGSNRQVRDSMYQNTAKDKPKETNEEHNYFHNEHALKKALELNPNDDSACVNLGQVFFDSARFAEAEQAFKKAVELNPKNGSAYTPLGRLYRMQKKFTESEQALKKALELNQTDFVYRELGWFYNGLKRYSEAEQAFRKALELNQTDSVYAELGWFYIGLKRYPDAEQAFKKAVEFNPRNDFIYAGLATLYREMGREELSMAYSEKADALRGEYYNPITVNNYLKLKQILDQRKIKLVCVQYPVRSVTALKEIFAEEKSVVFVDNEQAFKKAMKKEGIDEYFKDMFGGDFGHATPKGNRLLAQNIANSILKEVFDK
jgi:tetratricopeptide (TPR) repeat protein